MDLQPCRPSAKAPRDERGRPVWGRYNWYGWSKFGDFLERHGVPTDEMAGTNDGKRIYAKTCKLYAKTIREHIDDYISIWEGATKEEAERDALLWETCGGYRQY